MKNTEFSTPNFLNEYEEEYSTPGFQFLYEYDAC